MSNGVACKHILEHKHTCSQQSETVLQPKVFVSRVLNTKSTDTNIIMSVSSLFFLKASSALVISPLRETTASWTRSRPCVGSMRTSVTLAETQRGSPSSAPGPGHPVSTSSSSHTTRRVTEDSVVSCYLCVVFLAQDPVFFILFPHHPQI